MQKLQITTSTADARTTNTHKCTPNTQQILQIMQFGQGRLCAIHIHNKYIDTAKLTEHI